MKSWLVDLLLVEIKYDACVQTDHDKKTNNNIASTHTNQYIFVCA